MAPVPPVCNFALKALGREPPSTGGRGLRTFTASGAEGTVIALLRNHRPRASATVERPVPDARDLEARGVRSMAAGSGDTLRYPGKGFLGMRLLAGGKAFPFSCPHDVGRVEARAWRAVGMPGFLGYDRSSGLRDRRGLRASRGRIPAVGCLIGPEAA